MIKHFVVVIMALQEADILLFSCIHHCDSFKSDLYFGFYPPFVYYCRKKKKQFLLIRCIFIEQLLSLELF